VQQYSRGEDLSRDDQHAGVRESVQDAAPLFVVELRVDTMEEVKVGLDRRIGQKVVGAHLHVPEVLGEAAHRRGGVLRHHELPGRSDPVEAKLESSRANPVRGQALHAHPIEPSAERGGSLAEGWVVRCRLPRLAIRGQGERARGPGPERIPRLRADQIVPYEAALSPEVEVVPQRDRKHLNRR
jgi:hypothetical protein